MTLGRAEELRQEWKKAGNPECAPVVLVLQYTSKGFVSGEYACETCGAEVCHPIAGN